MPPRAPPTLLRAHRPYHHPLAQSQTLLSLNPIQNTQQPRRHNSGKANSFGSGNGKFKGMKSPGQSSAAMGQQSSQVSNKIGLKRSLPNDLGLLLGTLVMPSSATLPSTTQHPIKRTKMEFARLFKRAKDLISVFSYKFVQKPRLKIHFRKTAPTAAALHRQMYTALADGDTSTLKSLTCEGLQTHLTSLLSLRPRKAAYTWTLHRYTSPATVVSHRAAVLPIDDGSGHKTALRQAVVRIRSVQSLVRTDAPGGAEDVVEREVEEFVVVQRRVWKGVEERWRVQGTTERTSIEDWEDTLNPKIPTAQPT